MIVDLDNIFTPSASFLKAVGETAEKKIVTGIHSYKSIDKIRAEKKDIEQYVMDCANDLVDSIFMTIEQRPIMSIQPNDSIYDDGLSSMWIELVINSYTHSPAETGLHVKSFYGNNLGIGLFDGGSFYRQDWIKKSIESKTNILPNIHPSEFNLTGSGRNYGIENLYKYANFLEVDTTKGVLYLTVARDRFIRTIKSKNNS